MTREEKSKAIQNYCLTRMVNDEIGELCVGCPLNNIANIRNGKENCSYTDEFHPCDLDRNYDILVKAGLIVTDDEIKTADDKVDEAHKRFMNIGEDDKVNHPNHYCKGGIECIEAIRASMTKEAFAGYCKGNVIKYVFRYEQKGGKESLEKASVYLKWLIEAAKGESK